MNVGGETTQRIAQHIKQSSVWERELSGVLGNKGCIIGVRVYNCGRSCRSEGWKELEDLRKVTSWPSAGEGEQGGSCMRIWENRCSATGRVAHGRKAAVPEADSGPGLTDDQQGRGGTTRCPHLSLNTSDCDGFRISLTLLF